MKTFKTLLLLIMVSAGTSALALECLNYIAVDGQLLDGDGFAGQSACYFTSHGNSSDAFVRASLLAEALGLELSWDDAERSLVFKQGDRTGRYSTTTDPTHGLQRSTDVFSINGEPYDGNRAIPTAIVVEGASWVPVYPVADAFAADVEWHSEAKTIFIDTKEHVAALQDHSSSGDGTQPRASLDPPRVGRDQGVTRVAVDLPAGTEYRVAVAQQTMVVELDGVTAEQFSFGEEDPNIADVRYAAAQDSLALVIDARHTLHESGSGFRVGLVDRGDSEVLYVDFAPELTGQQVAALSTPPPADSTAVAAPAVRAPSTSAKTVVLDPGHGGIFGGARSPDGQIREEIVALEVAVRIKAILQAKGIKVIMTRNNNAHLADALVRDLQARADLATTDRNMFVSIHANAAANRNAHGIETYIFGEPLSEEVRQQAIRENGGGAVGRAVTDQAIEQANAWTGDLIAQQTLQLSRSLANTVQSSLISKTGARDRGVKQGPFHVLRNSRIPAVLVEVGFLTHPDEGRRLAKRDYQDRLAQAIASGIIDFFEHGGTYAHR